MTKLLGGDLSLHYNGFKAGHNGATFGLELPSATGWMALGFPAAGRPSSMVGASAVIVTTDAGPSGIGVYSLDGKSVGAVRLASSGGRRLTQAPFAITEATVARSSSRTLATFTRPFDDTFTADSAAKPYLAAMGDSNALSFHTGSGSFSLALSSAAAAAEDDDAPDTASPAPQGGCTPSPEEAFDCVSERFGGQMKIHYNGFQAGDTGATFGLELASATGWAGLGFPSANAPTAMVGSTAVIVTTDAGPSGIGVYSLEGKSVSDMQLAVGGGRHLAQAPFTISDATVARSSGRTFATFTWPFDDTFTADSTAKPFLAAMGDSNALSFHTQYGSFSLALSSAATAEAAVPDDGTPSSNTLDPTASGAATQGGCTPSPEAAFDCVIERLGGAVKIHYNGFQAGDTSAAFGLELASATGWLALGFPDADAPTAMVGSSAVIATSDAGPSGIGIYTLGGKSVNAIQLVAAGGRRLAQAPFFVSDATVARANGRTLATFSRPFDSTFTADAAAKPFLVAYGDTDALALHSEYSDFTLALSSSAAAGAESMGEDLTGWYRAHACCMALAWGVFAPSGVMVALTMRPYGRVSPTLGPLWFLGHRVCAVSAVVLSTVGFAIAVAKFNLESGDEYYHHKQIGYAVVILGWLQPLNALIRPHPPALGEKKPALRLAWEVVHKASGYSAMILGILNVFIGFVLGHERNMYEDKDEMEVFRIVFIVWLALWFLSGVVLFVVARIARREPDVMTGLGSPEGDHDQKHSASGEAPAVRV